MRNRLREDVKNVHYYVIFYDALGDPIDVIETWFDSPIPAGLAKRVRNRNPNPYRKIDTEFLIYAYHAFSVQDDVYELTEHLEIRVLDYEIVR